MNVDEWKIKALDFVKRKYQWMAIIMIALIGVMVSFSPETPENKTLPESADTYIPAGYVLVPIEVVNKQALESLLGSFGVVDLFLPSLDPSKQGKKVASRVKILRAPLKPDEFAVLVPEREASALVHHESGYFVVIQNPKQRGTKLVKPEVRRSRITYEDG